MSYFFSDLGIVNALGAGKTEVLRGLMAGDRSGMVAYSGLLTGRSTVVGRVRQPLRPLPPHVAEFDCRNNRLLATALDEIAPSIAHVASTVGAHRVAVVIGTPIAIAQLGACGTCRRATLR